MILHPEISFGDCSLTGLFSSLLIGIAFSSLEIGKSQGKRRSHDAPRGSNPIRNPTIVTRSSGTEIEFFTPQPSAAWRG